MSRFYYWRLRGHDNFGIFAKAEIIMNALVNIVASVKKAMTRLLEVLLMGALVVLVLDVLWGVGTRYILGDQSRWTEELARVLLIWVVLLGGAVAYGTREHLGLDYFVSKMDETTGRRMRIVVDSIVLAFTALVLLIGGYELVSKTFSLGQTMQALGIGKGWVYLSVPTSGAFFLLFSVESILTTWFGSSAPDRSGEAAA